jgi:hypothetical protein
MRTWRRSVLPGPIRRTIAVWLGLAIIAAATMGGNGMAPRGLVDLALNHWRVGVVFGFIWALLLWPAASELVRAQRAGFLRSLPSPHFQRLAWTFAVLLWMQLPIIGLCVAAGESAVAAIIALAFTLALFFSSKLSLPQRKFRSPQWRTAIGAHVAVVVRGVWRNSGASLVRSAGFMLLAGAAAAGFISNNQLHGNEASTFGATVLYALLVPALLPLVAEVVAIRRDMHTIDAALGMTGNRRQASFNIVIALIICLSVVIGVAVAVLIAPLTIEDAARLLGFALLGGIAVAMIIARGCLWAMRKTVGTLANLVAVFAIVMLSTGIVIGLLAELALLPLFTMALFAYFTVPRASL